MNGNLFKYGASVLSIAVLGGALYMASGSFSADDISQSVGVTNSAPTLNTPLIGTAANGSPVALEGAGGIDLTAGGNTSLYVYGVATDLNSCEEINAAADYTVTLYHSTATGTNACNPLTSGNENKCLTVAAENITLGVANACTSGTDTDISYSALVSVPYYFLASNDNVAHWKAYVTVNDGTATGNQFSGNYDINPLKALSVTSSVDYGTLALNGTSTNQSITFTNEGNSDANIGVTATDFTCAAGSFGIDKIKMGAPGFTYTDTEHEGIPVMTIQSLHDAWDGGAGTSQNIGLTAPTSSTASTQSLDLAVKLPSSGVSGSCSSTITFTAD